MKTRLVIVTDRFDGAAAGSSIAIEMLDYGKSRSEDEPNVESN
jgi:hypothetical protein